MSGTVQEDDPYSSIGGAAALVGALFDRSPFSTVLYDATGHIVSANPAFERLFGLSVGDIPPSYCVLSDPELERGGHLPLVARAFEGNVTVLPLVRYQRGPPRGE